MGKTKRGGANLSKRIKFYQPIMKNEKYKQARKVIQYSGEQLQLDQQKQAAPAGYSLILLALNSHDHSKYPK